MKLKISDILVLSPSIRAFTLEDAEGGVLPGASAGAHILLRIQGAERVWRNAYSLVSSPEDCRAYKIIVRRVEHSRGGSVWLHDHAAIGDVLEVEAPQNLFPVPLLAQKHLLLSAGIGITPMLAYLQVLRKPFELHHCGKLEDAQAFARLLPAAPNVILHTSRNTLDLERLLANQRLGTHLSVCGPEAFMDVVLQTAQNLGWPGSKVHKESFGGATGGAPFVVHLRRSNITVAVGAEQSLLEAIEDAGLAPPSLCRGGVCGVCETPLLEGVAEHHDHYLSEAQRACNKMIMPCVSRAKTPELVLDI